MGAANTQDRTGVPYDGLFLQDANISLETQQSFYTQLVLLIRQMYQECRLVHADLSEYNILVHEVSRLANYTCNPRLLPCGVSMKAKTITHVWASECVSCPFTSASMDVCVCWVWHKERTQVFC